MLRNIFALLKFDRFDVIDGDEVLSALNHKCAFQTLTVVSWFAAVLGALLVHQDHPSHVVGITLLGASCSYLLLFESLRAYHGVLRGQIELAIRHHKGKPFVVRLALRQAFITVLLSTFLQFLYNPTSDQLFKQLTMSIVVGIWTFFLSYQRWWRYSK